MRAGCAILAALAILLTACQVEDQAKRLNREGNEAYDAGDYQTALDRYRQAQVESPDTAAYIYNGGNALHRLGQFDRAITESQRASASGPDEVRFRAFYALGNHYVRQEKLREARDAYKNALKIISTDLDAKWNLEVVQRRLDQQQQERQPQQGQGDQQNQQGQQDQQGQQGQPQPGQQQGQPQPGQQPGQQSGQQNQPGQPDGQATAQELQRALQDATAEFERSLSVEAALRILDIVEQQRRLRQSQLPAAPPGGGRDQ